MTLLPTLSLGASFSAPSGMGREREEGTRVGGLLDSSWPQSKGGEENGGGGREGRRGFLYNYYHPHLSWMAPPTNLTTPSCDKWEKEERGRGGGREKRLFLTTALFLFLPRPVLLPPKQPPFFPPKRKKKRKKKKEGTASSVAAPLSLVRVPSDSKGRKKKGRKRKGERERKSPSPPSPSVVFDACSPPGFSGHASPSLAQGEERKGGSPSLSGHICPYFQFPRRTDERRRKKGEMNQRGLEWSRSERDVSGKKGRRGEKKKRSAAGFY